MNRKKTVRQSRDCLRWAIVNNEENWNDWNVWVMLRNTTRQEAMMLKGPQQRVIRVRVAEVGQ